jgi:hypothetical protein
MIESLHADVAIRAVRCPWRPEYVARTAEFHAKTVGFYWKDVHFMIIPHHTISIPFINGYRFQFLVLVMLQYLGNHPRIGQPNDQQYNLDHEIENSSDDKQRQGRGPSSGHVVQSESDPYDQMREEISLGLGYEKSADEVIGLVIGGIGDLMDLHRI